MKRKGAFITIEGTDGSGKSTQAALLVERLQRLGLPAVLTHEPGWGAVGEALRRLLLDERSLRLDPFAELCLFCADRAQHVTDLIAPELERGSVVVCDRFSDSTVAYQGYGRRLDLALVERMAWEAARGLKPDLTVLLDLPFEEGLKRIDGRGGRTKLDDETLAFHRRVWDGYRRIAAADPRRVATVDAARGVDEVARDVFALTARTLVLEEGRDGDDGRTR